VHDVTLRWKTFLVIGITITALVAGIYVAFRVIVLDSFRSLEEEVAHQDTRRAVAAVEARLTMLATTTEDYGTWDDTYRFLVDRNEQFLASNSTPVTLAHLRINVMAYLLPDWTLVNARAIAWDDAGVRDATAPPALFERLGATPSPPAGRSGIVMTPEGPMLAAQRPALTTLGQGPPRGWVVMARFLDAAEIRSLGETTRLDLAVFPLADRANPPEVADAVRELEAGAATVVRTRDEGTIAGYALLADVAGRPALLLRQLSPRGIHRHARLAHLYLLVSLLLAGGVVGGAALWLLERTVLPRLAHLGGRVDAVRASGDLSQRVSVPGRGDELGRLAEAINSMLAALQASQESLQEQRSLRESEERFRRLVELSPLAVFIESEGRVVFANGAAAELLGVDAAGDLIGRALGELVTEDCRASLEDHLRRALEQRERSPYAVLAFRRPGGAVVEAEIAVTSHPYGDRPAVQLVAYDVTERQRAEEARDRLAMAVEQSHDAIVISDTAPRVVYVNPAFERMTGYARAEVIGREPDFIAADGVDTRALRRKLARMRAGNWSGPLPTRHKDGTRRETEALISPIVDASGVVVSYVAVLRDVTAEHRMEDRLRQAQKMEAIGRLAGGVAHDFNNILSAILGYSELLLAQLPPGGEVRSYLEEIRSAGQRAAALTRQLLAFSRKQVFETRVLDLNRVVANVERMLRRMIGEDVELVTRLQEGLWSVRADPGQMEQVLANFSVNARDAMPRGGRLTIGTANVARPAAGGAAPAGDAVELSVSDTGVGMPPEVLAHLFEPFFTTKEPGKGTGLGLSMVYGIVQQSSGHMEVESEVGRGTTFRVYLPRAAGAPASEEPSRAPGRPLRGTETVLVVEDAEPVRTLARRILERFGYLVLEARTADEALRICREHAGPIQLLLTDVVMPGMDGRDLAQRVGGLRREARVLYMSGHPREALDGQGERQEAQPLVRKPFTPEDLLARIREVLGA
jgi:PAS domain S-box-containing protein